MPPAPKHPSARQRRNKVAGARTLTAVDDVDIPELPDLDGGWHALTAAWWAAIWSSPMAPEFDPSDLHGLYRLAMLVDGYYRAPSTAIAAEIRLQEQRFGLSPLDRRRLQWEIDRGDEAEQRTTKRRNDAKPKATARRSKVDPRSMLA